MLQQKIPEDFVIASGKQCSVRDFIKLSASELGVTLRFEGSGNNEVGIISNISSLDNSSLKEGDIIVRVDERYFRPAETDSLLGDSSKARKKLNWSPKISIEEMCSEMISEDLNRAKNQALIKNRHSLDKN